jgi:hypothetical protein
VAYLEYTHISEYDGLEKNTFGITRETGSTRLVTASVSHPETPTQSAVSTRLTNFMYDSASAVKSVARSSCSVEAFRSAQRDVAIRAALRRM